MNKKYLSYIKIVSMIFLICAYMLFIPIFYGAYVGDDRAITIYIDMYNEAEFEYILLLISLPFVLLGTIMIFYDNIKNVAKNRRKK